MNYIWLIIALLVGFAAGFFIGRVKKEDICGTLQIDRSDPYSPPLLFLELKTDVAYISKKKTVVFNVKDEDIRI